MRHLFMALVIWLGSGLPLWAACNGTDLRPSLSAQQQAELEQRLATVPYPTGNHWTATKGDEVLHLIGTIHLDHPRLNAPTQRLRPVLEQAGLLLLEMTEREQAELISAMGTNPDYLIMPNSTMPELLPEEEWQQLSQGLQARGIPAMMGAKMQPWYLATILSIPACMAELLQEQRGLDARLEDMADQLDLPTQALEPFDTAFSIFASVPMDQQLAMVRSAIGDNAGQEDLFATLIASYFEEEIAQGQEVLEMLTPEFSAISQAEMESIYDSFNEGLLSKRNHAWIPVLIKALEETREPVVAAFGAAHLSGENGVLNLLAQQGFTLERQKF